MREQSPDWEIKRSRLRDLNKATPAIFPIVRKSDAEPIPGCCLCSERFYQRVQILLDTPHFFWHTKDYFYIPGDSMLTLKTHKDKYNNLAPEEFAEFLFIVDAASEAYHQVAEVRDITILQAVGGKVAGQGVEHHFHAHCFPRYQQETENLINVTTLNNFVIQDASSYYLARIMQKFNPGLQSLAQCSNEFPGGFQFEKGTSPLAALRTLQELETSFYDAMSSAQQEFLSETYVERKVAILGKIAGVNPDMRQKAIFEWMAKAFLQKNLHLFGYNLFFKSDGSIIFLPRSGIVGGKRIGAVSIFGNLHWSTKSLGDEITPAIYQAPYDNYPVHFTDFNNKVISELRKSVA